MTRRECAASDRFLREARTRVFAQGRRTPEDKRMDERTNALSVAGRTRHQKRYKDLFKADTLRTGSWSRKRTAASITQSKTTRSSASVVGRDARREPDGTHLYNLRCRSTTAPTDDGRANDEDQYRQHRPGSGATIVRRSTPPILPRWGNGIYDISAGMFRGLSVDTRILDSHTWQIYAVASPSSKLPCSTPCNFR